MAAGSEVRVSKRRNHRALATLVLLAGLILTVELGEAVLGGMGLAWLAVVLVLVELGLWVLVLDLKWP